MNNKLKKQIIIAGPCAAESREQVIETVINAKKRNVDFVRMNLWKPRTKPGFDGMGEAGIPLLVEAAKMGVNPGTEVILPQHAEKVISAVLNASSTVNVLVWIGARNQNHYIQQEIASVAKGEKRVKLMVKNQPWVSEEHWEGVIEHVLHGGIDEKNLIVCHRGFVPNGHNPCGFRNVPDFKMAMKIKDKTGLKVIFDPSHVGGSTDNVILAAKQASEYPFDGMIIEVHPKPTDALTDAKQQLTWEIFDELQNELEGGEINVSKNRIRNSDKTTII